MIEPLHVTMHLDPFSFTRFMVEDDMKKYIREKLAHELAIHIINSKYTTFTYAQSPEGGANVHAKILLR